MSTQSNFPNIKPSLLLDFANTKTLDPRITFTRSTTATYYDGKTVAKAEENTLLYSQDFSNGIWALQEVTLSANSTTAPDGTATASTISTTTSGNIHRFYQPLYSFTKQTAYSFSVYLKYKDHQYVSFGLTDNSYYRTQVVVNLVAGTIVQNYVDGYSPTDTLTSTITSVGNGWYRVTAVFIPAVPIIANLYWLGTLQQSGSFTAGGWVGTGTGYYMWGAQVEQRNAATAYTPTTSQPITNYVPQLLTAGTNQARFDHNPTTGESLGLLIEEQRTNIVQQSATLSNWSKVQIVLTTEGIAPDGTLTAQKAIAAGTDPTAYQACSGANTISIYAKAAGKSWLCIINQTGSAFAAWFNLSTGTLGTVTGGYTATMTAVGNGWYRCILTVNSGTFAYHQWAVCDQDSDNTATVNAVNGIFIWGAQAEAGAFATSFIATPSAQVTRTADTATITGSNLSSWFQPQRGSLYIESSYLKSGTRSPFQFGSSISNRYGFYTPDAALNYFDGSVPFSTSLSSITSKIACSLVNYDVAVSFNNSTATAVGGKALANVDKLTIGGADYGGEYICGTIRKIAYYPARLSNTQLQALTA